MSRLRLACALTLAAAFCAPAVSPAGAAAPSCGVTAAADEWPTFGRDLANTRTQPSAGGLSPTTAPLLQPVWSFATGSQFAGTGDLNGTPIVAGGCVFLNTAAGDVVALNASTGTRVWSRHVPVPAAGLGGTFVGSPVFVPASSSTDRLHGKGRGHGGVVTTDLPAHLIVLVSELDKPYAMALSPIDGSVQWTSEPIVSGPGYYTNATPVAANGLLLAGFSPAEGDPTQRGGISLFDVDTGALVKRVFSIPDVDFAKGYAGAGIWTAPAVDADNGYAYAGTSNPYSKKFEHPNSNAILKIDIDPTRATFGTVVDSYKGLIEQYRQEVRDAVDPVCQAVGDDPNLQLVVGDSAPCLQMDLDFGAPPNLFRDAAGNQLIGDLQKAGVYHAVRTSTMDESWQATVGAPCAACNAAAWAWDGKALVGASSPVGTEWALDSATGGPRWASPIADGTHYQSTSVAGGVAFTVDNAGNLLGWDVATGAPLVKRPVQADAGATGVAAALSSSGVAIASGLVIVAADNVVVAYRPLATP